LNDILDPADADRKRTRIGGAVPEAVTRVKISAFCWLEAFATWHAAER